MHGWCELQKLIHHAFMLLLLVRLAFHKNSQSSTLMTCVSIEVCNTPTNVFAPLQRQKCDTQQVKIVLLPPASRRARLWHLLPRLLSCTALPGTTLRLAKSPKDRNDGWEENTRNVAQVAIWLCCLPPKRLFEDLDDFWVLQKSLKTLTMRLQFFKNKKSRLLMCFVSPQAPIQQDREFLSLQASGKLLSTHTMAAFSFFDLDWKSINFSSATTVLLPIYERRFEEMDVVCTKNNGRLTDECSSFPPTSPHVGAKRLDVEPQTRWRLFHESDPF